MLVPSERTSGGHRLYAAAEVRRLYRLLALRRLGLGLEEIAVVLDDPGANLLDTVRRHLEQVESDLERQQKLRDRLRQVLDALERSVEPSIDALVEVMEAMSTIEAKVDDVLIRLPREEADDPPRRLARESQRVVLLREQHGERVLPIWIGAQEGDALVYQRSGRTLPRPLGPDLTAQLLSAGGVQVERVVIESLRENTYYASVSLTAAGESQEVDARPSDALNLAIRLDVPVFVAAEVFDEAGVASDSTLRARLGETDATATAETDPDEWRSVTPELIGSLFRSETALVFEHLTTTAQQVMALAQEEAQSQAEDHVATHHILSGLLRAETPAARILASSDLTQSQLRAGSGGRERSRPREATGKLPLTPSARKVLELALREALALGTGNVAAEHILLALTNRDKQTLSDLGVAPDQIRLEVNHVLGRGTSEASSGSVAEADH